MLHDQIYRETAQWIVKIQHAPLNETEQLEFEQWKQQSSQHQAAWSKAERLLYSLEEFSRRWATADSARQEKCPI